MSTAWEHDLTTHSTPRRSMGCTHDEVSHDHQIVAEGLFHSETKTTPHQLTKFDTIESSNFRTRVVFLEDDEENQTQNASRH